MYKNLRVFNIYLIRFGTDHMEIGEEEKILSVMLRAFCMLCAAPVIFLPQCGHVLDYLMIINVQ